MKQIIIEVLKKAITSSGLKQGKKSIKSESDLLDLKPNALMKLYNQAVPHLGNVEHICQVYGQAVTDDKFRSYMIDKLDDIYYKVGVIYCPDIEDEISITDEFLSSNDEYIARVYNHNMFDHDFINWKNN